MEKRNTRALAKKLRTWKISDELSWLQAPQMGQLALNDNQKHEPFGSPVHTPGNELPIVEFSDPFGIFEVTMPTVPDPASLEGTPRSPLGAGSLAGNSRDDPVSLVPHEEQICALTARVQTLEQEKEAASREVESSKHQLLEQVRTLRDKTQAAIQEGAAGADSSDEEDDEFGLFEKVKLIKKTVREYIEGAGKAAPTSAQNTLAQREKELAQVHRDMAAATVKHSGEKQEWKQSLPQTPASSLGGHSNIPELFKATTKETYESQIIRVRKEPTVAKWELQKGMILSRHRCLLLLLRQICARWWQCTRQTMTEALRQWTLNERREATDKFGLRMAQHATETKLMNCRLMESDAECINLKEVINDLCDQRPPWQVINDLCGRELAQDKDTAAHKADQARSRIASLEKELLSARGEKHDMEATMQQLSRRHETELAHVASLAHRQGSILEQRLQHELTDAEMSSKHELAQSAAENEALRSAVQAEKERLELAGQEMERLREDHMRREEESFVEMKELRAEVAALKESVARSEQRAVAAAVAKETLESQVEFLQNQHLSAMCTLEKRHSLLKQQYEAAQEGSHKHQAAAAEYAQHNAVLLQRVSQAAKHHEDVVALLAEATVTRDAAVQELSGMEERCAALRHQYNEALHEAEERNRSLSMKLETLEQSVKSSEAEAEHRVHELLEQLCKLQVKMQTAVQAAAQAVCYALAQKEGQLAQAQHELQAMEQKLASLRKSAAGEQLEMECKQLKKTVEREREEREAIEGVLAQVRQDMAAAASQAQRTLAAEQAKFAIATMAMEQERRGCSELSAKWTDLEDRMAMKERQHQRERDAERTRCELAESEAMQAVTEKEALAVVVKRLQNETSSTTVKHAAEKQEWKQQIEELQERAWQQSLSPTRGQDEVNAKKRCDVLHATNCKLELEIMSLQACASDLESQMQAMERKVVVAEREAEEAIAKLRQGDDIESEKLRRVVDELCEELAQDKVTAAHKADQARSRIASLEKELLSARGEKHDMEATMQQLSRRHETELTHAKRQGSRAYHKMQHELTDAEMSSKHELALSAAENEALRSAVQAEKEKLELAGQEMERLREDHMRREEESFVEMKELRAEVAALKESVARSEQRDIQASIEAEHKKANNASLMKAFEDIQQRHAMLTTSHMTTVNEAEELKVMVAKLETLLVGTVRKDQYKELHTQHLDTMSLLDQERATKSKLMADITILEQRLAARESHHDRVIQTERIMADMAHQDAREAGLQHASLETQVRDLQRELARRDADVVDARCHVVQLNSELEAVRTQLSALEVTSEELVVCKASQDDRALAMVDEQSPACVQRLVNEKLSLQKQLWELHQQLDIEGEEAAAELDEVSRLLLEMKMAQQETKWSAAEKMEEAELLLQGTCDSRFRLGMQQVLRILGFQWALAPFRALYHWYTNHQRVAWSNQVAPALLLGGCRNAIADRHLSAAYRDCVFEWRRQAHAFTHMREALSPVSDRGNMVHRVVQQWQVNTYVGVSLNGIRNQWLTASSSSNKLGVQCRSPAVKGFSGSRHPQVPMLPVAEMAFLQPAPLLHASAQSTPRLMTSSAQSTAQCVNDSPPPRLSNATALSTPRSAAPSSPHPPSTPRSLVLTTPPSAGPSTPGFTPRAHHHLEAAPLADDQYGMNHIPTTPSSFTPVVSLDLIPRVLGPPVAPLHGEVTVEQYLGLHHKPLSTIYTYYARQDTISSPSHNKLSWSEFKKASNELTLNEFQGFAREFKLVTIGLSNTHVVDIFHNSMYGPGGRLGATFDEFERMVVRVAACTYGKFDHMSSAQRACALLQHMDRQTDILFKIGLKRVSSSSAQKLIVKRG